MGPFIPDTSPEARRFRGLVDGRRSPPPIIIRLARLADAPDALALEPAALLDTYATGEGFSALGRGWRAVPVDDAVPLVRRLFSGDALNAIVGGNKAERLARGLVNLFGPEARYFTNVEPEKWRDGVPNAFMWSPLTAHTFDFGLAAVGPERIGFLWGYGED